MRRQHDRQCPGPRILVTVIVDRCAHRDAGIVDDDIERAEMRGDVADDCCDGVAVGDVERPGLAVPPLAAISAANGLCRLGVDVGNGDLGALAANTSAVARPMPLAAPVTRTVRPLIERLSCLKSDMAGLARVCRLRC